MNHIVEDLKIKIARIHTGGPEHAHARLKEKNKYFVRERLYYVLDQGAPFLELSPLAGYLLYDQEEIPAAGLITGIGVIHGAPVMVIANDATVKGGSYYPITVRKHLRAQEIAKQHGLPCIYLVDTAGIFLPRQEEIFADHDHFGRIFYNQARMSVAGIPQISVVLGTCVAGGAYIPVMSDRLIMVNGQSHLFLGGPDLVQAATGEIIDSESLGGADTHTRISGVADDLVFHEQEAFQKIRDCATFWPKWSTPYIKEKIHKPHYSEEELLGIIPSDPKVSIPIREIITRLIDDSEWDEFKARYGETLVCGLAHIWGYPIGILGNQGILFSESLQKGAQFIAWCDRLQIPIVFLQNITGMMVGSAYERAGIARHGAQMIRALSIASVPKITVVVGNSYGAGNYAMCGRAYNGNFLWMWPNARIAVMGGAQAAQVLSRIHKKTPSDIIHTQYDSSSTAYFSSARLWDDGVILPQDTRRVLGLCLALVNRKSPNKIHTNQSI